MQKLDRPQTKDYGPLIMWASDLEYLFAELNNCTGIEFVADDVKFESVDEFVEFSKGRNPSSVEITAGEPYLSIELYQRWARIYVSSSDLLASGLFLKIDSILSRCERKPRFFYQYAWVIGSVIVIPNIFYLPPLKSYDYLNLWASVFAFSWMLYVAFIHLWRFSIVRPMHREESPGFFRRNIDAIVVAVIAALFGAIVGVAGTKMVEKVWPGTNPVAPQVDQPLAEPPSS